MMRMEICEQRIELHGAGNVTDATLRRALSFVPRAGA
jgi:hypothetical protein